MEKKQKIQIAVVGAGLIGTSFALCFQDQPVHINLLENRLDDVLKKAKEDTRPISLSYGSTIILNALGVWKSLKNYACPIKTVHVSEQGRFGCTRITASEQKVPALGYVVPFSQLQTAIYEKVAAQSNVTFTEIKKINAIKTSEAGATANIQENKRNTDITADLLVAADGTNSFCRKQLNIATTTENKGDCALIYLLDLNKPHDFTAYERFTKLGVLAILPLPEKNKARLVWSITPKIENTLNQWCETDVFAFLKSAFEGRLSIASIQKTAQFPLQTTLAETQILSGAVLLGNAAHAIYPVAAQGFNLGLRDTAVLRDVLLDTIKNEKPIGCKQALKRYIDLAMPHQQAIIKLTNQLTPLFELQFPGAGCARGLGLVGMDIIKPLKNRLADRTMGITDRRPSLLRTSE